jgi:hypothetical protein
MQNGSYRGFGFSDKTSALEMKDRVEKAVRPYSIGSNPPCQNAEQSVTESSSKNSSSAVVLYRTVPRRSSSRRLTNKGDVILSGTFFLHKLLGAVRNGKRSEATSNQIIWLFLE